jgi:hypothetical protein
MLPDEMLKKNYDLFGFLESNTVYLHMLFFRLVPIFKAYKKMPIQTNPSIKQGLKLCIKNWETIEVFFQYKKDCKNIANPGAWRRRVGY